MIGQQKEQAIGDHKSDTPDSILYESSDQMKDVILKYAIQQAEYDDRLFVNVQHKDNILYDNFSLIVSYDPVTAQQRHIDLLYPNFQYGLMITNMSPGTLVFSPTHAIRTVTDVNNHVWKDMPSTLKATIQHDTTVTSLLSQFGNILCPDIKPVKYWEQTTGESIGGDSKEMRQECVTNSHTSCSTTNDAISVILSTGALLSLPGSEIHAGPSSSKYRAVLFFTACPDKTNTIPYHTDTQYFAPSLCCDMIYLLWNDLSIPDRIYLLYRLMDSINVTKFENLESHITDAKMIHFLRMVTRWEDKNKRTCRTTNKKNKYSSLDAYIHDFASN
jgi:hypothetical protein